MDYNKIANLIVSVYYSHDSYEDTISNINYFSSLVIKNPEKLTVEPLSYTNFNEEYLISLDKYWSNKQKELEEKYK